MDESDNPPDGISHSKLNHYRTYLKIYGFLIMELADTDEEIIKLINGEFDDALMQGLRERIEHTPVYAHSNLTS